MLPLPNLDDRMFEQMVRDARHAIPKLFPQWTDENAHDPGMTMLELLSWMTELQQYYLNRITAKNELKYLKLLGVRPFEERTASCEAEFSGIVRPATIPAGTPLQAYDQRFETTRSLRLIPAVVEKALVRTATATGDFSSNLKTGIAFYAFGRQAVKGNRLFIGIDGELPADTDIGLTIRLDERYPVPKGEGPGGAPTATAHVRWSSVGAGSGGEDDRQPLDIIEDTTAQLSQSGKLIFRLTGPMKPTTVYPADDRRRYWLVCELVQEGYELAPKLDGLSLNTVLAEQRQTYVETMEFDSTGEPGMICEADSYLACTGKTLVQVRGERGEWSDWQSAAKLDGCAADETACVVERNESPLLLRIRFGDGEHGAVPPAGRARIRLVAWDPEFEERLWVGRSDGLPDQHFDISRFGLYRSDTMKLQAAALDRRSGQIVWHDWERVDDFDNSLSTDRHYVYDRTEGAIVFGNNEEGAIPAKSGAPGLRFISLQSGGGQRGNVKKGMLASFAADHAEWRGLTVTNPLPAVGGAEAETIAEAKLRVLRDLNAPTRAVTADDCERLARATPGLRVARVKAIPLYRPGLRDYPRETAPAQLTVVVVPYSEDEKPEAGPGFLETVHRHLDRHRLLTTELHVISAAYIKITVHAVVVVEPQARGDADRVVGTLKRLLRPMGHGDGDGWPFGHTVHKGDLYGEISRLPGVVYVQDLWIDAEGPAVRKDGAGDIHLPPYGLVYSGDHAIELMSVDDV